MDHLIKRITAGIEEITPAMLFYVFRATAGSCAEMCKWYTLKCTKEQYSGVLDKLNKERPAEDESDLSDIDAEVTEYSDHETDSENDVDDNPVHEEDGDTNSDINVCIIHPFNSNLISP
ncbi:hypothetical protein AVEN_118413-1 [Araneus ventricosus]|uniref:Uncharacterized protein n=1 Tax=Araneus ventricosus TaxID=182803 RepID=A0A4Y2B5K6_ARAVE|nr:hypothetical protein AVEN_118413-1 [Araneus ventricosus]